MLAVFVIRPIYGSFDNIRMRTMNMSMKVVCIVLLLFFSVYYFLLLVLMLPLYFW